MKDLFQNPALQTEFIEQGFVVVPLLTTEDIDQLLAIFKEHFPETPQAFYSSSYLNDFDQKKAMSDKIGAIIRPRFGALLKNYRHLGSAFLTKAPGPHSELPMHQDWTIVDEAHFVAVNIWTPITEVTLENGTLQVLPGSHTTFRTLRAPTIPFSGSNVTDQLKKHMQPLVIKPGEAVILDQALVHYSGPNNSTEPRLAITSGVVSEKAELSFHYWNKEDSSLEKYAQADDFLLRFEDFHQSIFQRPTIGQLEETSTYEPQMISEEALAALIGTEESTTIESTEPPASSGFVSQLLKRIFG